MVKRTVLLLLFLSFVVFSSPVHAVNPNPAKAEAAVDDMFRTFFGRPASNQPYDGSPKQSEQSKFFDIIMSANGKDMNQLSRAVDIKVREVIDILVDRDEYLNMVKPINWSENYWHQFVTKCQKDFERKFNPSAKQSIDTLVSRAMKKEWGNDHRQTRVEIIQSYKKSPHFKQHVEDIVHNTLYDKPVTPQYERIVDEIFQRFLQRTANRDSNDSEYNRFFNELKSAGSDRNALQQKIRGVIDTISDRREFRDKAGYKDWTIKYWTSFITLCAKTFEGRDVGPDNDWANKIIQQKGRYKTIEKAQDAVMDQFKRSDRYGQWVKTLSNY